jgi:hypothetical protein
VTQGVDERSVMARVSSWVHANTLVELLLNAFSRSE